MRITFDTNIFVNAIINNDYKIAVDNFINKRNSFLPISLNNEIRNIILKIHTILVKISYNYSKNKALFEGCLKEPDLLELKDKFENLYIFLKNLKNDPKLKAKIELMADITTSILGELSKVKLHPPEEGEVQTILQRMNSKINLLEKKVEDKADIKHLILAEAFAEIFADNETYFITDDYKDIINNKIYIESVLNYIKVFDFKSSPVSLT